MTAIACARPAADQSAEEPDGRFAPLTRYLARRFARSGPIEFDDLLGVGLLALVECRERIVAAGSPSALVGVIISRAMMTAIRREAMHRTRVETVGADAIDQLGGRVPGGCEGGDRFEALLALADSAHDRWLLDRRFRHGDTLEVIGAAMGGRTKEAAWQAIDRALSRLRVKLGPDAGP